MSVVRFQAQLIAVLSFDLGASITKSDRDTVFGQLAVIDKKSETIKCIF